jgi:hypothetical protein
MPVLSGVQSHLFYTIEFDGQLGCRKTSLETSHNLEVHMISQQQHEALLTPEQASSLLGVALQTLAIWRSTGRYDLPYVKIGRKVLYKQEHIKAFIERRTRGD